MKIAANIGETFFGGSGFLQQTEDVGTLTSNLIRVAMGVAGIIFIVLLIGGGIGMIAGAGNDNPEQAAKGKQAVTSAMVGFIVVFAAYWIVQLIEQFTGLKLL